MNVWMFPRSMNNVPSENVSFVIVTLAVLKKSE